MAENKTEKPTPRRLKEARKKGDIPKSADLTQAIVFVGAAAVLAIGGGLFVDQLKAFAADSFDPKILNAETGNAPALLNRTGHYFVKFFLLLSPLVVGVTALAIASNFLQTRGLFATEVLSPKFEKLNPAAGFKRLFLESRTYVEALKSGLKLGLILWLGYLILRSMLPQMLMSGRLPLPQIGGIGAHAAFLLLFAVGGAFLLIGVGDYFLQNQLYLKKMRMSKDEVKRDFKQELGDPEIRQRRRQIHREILTQNVAERMPRATALVVNPTHLAVALEYDAATMDAPQVTAKGQEQLAAQMIALAKQHEVPIIRNIPLAHSLYQVDIDNAIPEELFDAVAEILNWVYDLTNREPL